MNKKLTTKQSLFVREYLVDLNATQAAIRAGYSKKTAAVIANENLSKPYIAEAIAAQSSKREEQVEADGVWVLNKLKQVAERCMQEEEVMIRDGKDLVGTGEFRFDSSGANKALELIGKHHRLFVDRTEVDLHNHDDDIDKLR